MACAESSVLDGLNLSTTGAPDATSGTILRRDRRGGGAGVASARRCNMPLVSARNTSERARARRCGLATWEQSGRKRYSVPYTEQRL
jgi:hypothetical protein